MMAASPQCGCKGSRVCSLCGPKDVEAEQARLLAVKRILFCNTCRTPTSNEECHNTCRLTCPELPCQFEGVVVYPDFISPAEEDTLVQQMDAWHWTLSQSGRAKQDFGPKANFKRQKVKPSNFTGLPALSQPLVERMQQLEGLEAFHPVEQCHLDYRPELGATIVPHRDDAWLWGERLVTLNLLSDTVLTFQPPGDHGAALEVGVPLPRYSLVVVQGAARHAWTHAIHRHDVIARRVAVTLRELTPLFTTGERAEEGCALLKLAASYQGVPM